MGIVRFDEIARECRETFKGSFTDMPIVGLEHIEPYDMKLKNYEVNVETTFTKQFHEGQILFGRRRAYQHKACVATFDGICSGDITVIEPIEGKVYPDLLPFIIQNDDFFEHAIKGSNGALSPRVKWEHMANFEFNLPSLAEQKVLAEKLWAAYEVKQSYLKMIAATEEMVKAQFVEMFKGCSKIGLGELATFINGTAFKPEDWSTEGLPIVRIQNLNDESSDYNYYNGDCSKKVKINNGDILVSWSATLGVFLWNKDKALLNQHIFKVVFDKVEIDKEFFFYTVSVVLDDMSKHTHGSTMKHIVKREFDKFPVAYPSIEMQREFARIARQADKSVSELRKSVEAIDKVIKSLINENL